MDKQKRIEEEIERTLALFENMEKLEPNPYLFTRLKAAFDESKTGSDAETQKQSFVLKLMPAFFVLLILFNFYSLFDLASSDFDVANSVESRTEYLQEISSEYMLSQTAYYPITME